MTFINIAHKLLGNGCVRSQLTVGASLEEGGGVVTFRSFLLSPELLGALFSRFPGFRPSVRHALRATSFPPGLSLTVTCTLI